MFKIVQGLNDINEGRYTCNSVLDKGTAVQLSAATSTVLVAATGEPLGFLLEDVTADGPSDFEYQELPGIAYDEVQTGSYVRVVDGNGLLATTKVGTTITAATHQSKMTITSGLWEVATTGDTVCGFYEKSSYDGVSGRHLIKRVSGGAVVS